MHALQGTMPRRSDLPERKMQLRRRRRHNMRKLLCAEHGADAVSGDLCRRTTRSKPDQSDNHVHIQPVNRRTTRWKCNRQYIYNMPERPMRRHWHRLLPGYMPKDTASYRLYKEQMRSEYLPSPLYKRPEWRRCLCKRAWCRLQMLLRSGPAGESMRFRVQESRLRLRRMHSSRPVLSFLQ
jgi:hypothetical protein